MISLSLRRPLITVLALSFMCLAPSTPSFASLACLFAKRDVADSVVPSCFNSRSEAVVRVLLIHYGSAMTNDDLLRLRAPLEKRFFESTRGLLRLEVIDSQVVPLKVMSRSLGGIADEINGPEDMKDVGRLTRLWYYYKRSAPSIVEEVHAEMLRAGLKPQMKNVDAVLLVTETQFDGLGVAVGAFAMTKQPTEIAWSGKGGGSTVYEKDVRLIDELTHELGHVLGLDHPSQQCEVSTPVTTEKLAQYRQCCQDSPGGEDVMSYCRGRDKVSDTIFYGFTDCTRGFLESRTLPRLLNGGERPSQSPWGKCL